MQQLILVRHSETRFDRMTPPEQWGLSDEGRLRCQPLAERLTEYDPGIVVTSKEPKALQTGQIIATRLGIPIETGDNLHQIDRRAIGLLPSKTAYQEAVFGLFRKPTERIFGEETADEARLRFAGAIEGIVGGYPGINPLIVAHGLVITLFVAHLAGYSHLNSGSGWKCPLLWCCHCRIMPCWRQWRE